MAPELDPKWWDKKRPLTLKSTGFGKQLKAYKDAVAAYDATTDAKARDAAYETAETLITKTLPAAAETAKKTCNTTLHKEGIATLTAYKAIFTKEAARLAAIQANRVKLDGKAEAKAAAHEADELAKAKAVTGEIEGLLDEATAAQTKLLAALGAVDKAKQVALAGRKAKNDKAIEAAGAAAERGMQEAAKLFAEVQALQTKAKGKLAVVRKHRDAVSGSADLGRAFKDADTLTDKIGTIADDAGYEVKDAMKAENELRQIIQGTMDDATAVATTIDHTCARFELNHRTIQGVLNQMGGTVDKLNFNIMNAEDSNDPATVQEAARLAKATLPGITDQVMKAAAAAVKASKEFRGEAVPLAAEAAKYAGVDKGVRDRLDRQVEVANGLDAEVKKVLESLKKMQAKVKSLGG